MNLAIDIGNSAYKAAVYKQHEKLFTVRSGISELEPLSKILSENNIENVILSSVLRDNSLILESFDSAGIKNIRQLTYHTRLPFRSAYRSMQTIGADRIAAVAGAYNMFPGRNVLIIDAGTAITYDMLLKDGIFAGGNISPGLKMRFRALHEFTGRLPLVEQGEDFVNLADNTESAIRSGVQSGLIFEINEYIRNLKIDYKDLIVLFTGGDSNFLANKIEGDIKTEPDLVVDGLNYILNYNAQNT